MPSRASIWSTTGAGCINRFLLFLPVTRSPFNSWSVVQRSRRLSYNNHWFQRAKWVFEPHGLVLTGWLRGRRFTTLQALKQSQQQQLKPTNFLPLPKQDDVVWGITNCHLVVVDIHNLTEVLKLHIELIQSCLRVRGFCSNNQTSGETFRRSGAASRSGRQFERG